MKDLNSLSLFAMVVEANSFSEAARRMKLPLATVSRRVAELENDLGVRLLDRSTRHLRPTDTGLALFNIAQQSIEIDEAVETIISNRRFDVSGTVRLATPPSISNSLIEPVVTAFQAAHPEVLVQGFVTERIVDQIADDVDIAFMVGTSLHPTLEADILLSYRHQLVASAAYLALHEPPNTPRELLDHRLLAFSFWRPDYSWQFTHCTTGDVLELQFQPSVAMNDYAGLSRMLVEGCGIGELPPILKPNWIVEGRLVELLPEWHLPVWNLSIAHSRLKQMPRHVRAFKDFAASMVPALFPKLPH
jgi:DNA-binding transcriptional LysR family regulator